MTAGTEEVEAGGVAHVSEPWPLARRGPELDIFANALADPRHSVVTIYGPAGVGKSRLADACLELADGHGRLTARVIASQSAALLPLGALAPVLPGDLGSSAAPNELFERTRAEFEALGGGGRLVLMVDDAHLLDTSSAVLLTQLINAGAVFVMATIRDGELLPDAVAGWWRSESAVRFDLRDLDRPAIGEVLTLALGGLVGTDTVHRLHEASGGNPLLLRELVLQALDGDLLNDDSGTWRLSGELAPSRRLVDVLGARLGALDDPARSILDQLALCAPLGPAELTGGDTEVTAMLESLESAGLIRVLVDGNRHQLVLGHPLYGDVLRAGLTVLRRRAILLAAAARVEALDARRREDARRVATWRLDAGGTPDPDLLLQAARVARYAHDFAQVQRLATVLREICPVASIAECAVLLGEAHYELGHFDESEQVLSAAVPPDSAEALLVQRATLRTKNLQWGLCDADAALRVVLEAQAALGTEFADDLVAEHAAVLMFSGHPQRALDVMASVEGHTPRTRVMVAITRGPALASIGQTTAAVEVSAAGFLEHSELSEPLALAHPGTHIVNQSFSLVEAGRLDEAEELASLGHDIAVNDRIPVAQIWFALVLAKSTALRGRLDEAARWYREGASTARLHRFRGPLRIALAGLAAAEAALGHTGAAAAAIEEYDELPAFPFLGHDQAVGPAWTAWAEGDPERARSILLASAAAAVATDNVGSAGWLWHDAARLGATGLAGRLASLAERSDSALLAARAAHVAALESDDGDALAAVSARLEELGLVLVAAEAAAAASDAHRRAGDQRSGASLALRSGQLADRCPGVRTPGLLLADVSVPLTAREREIAALAASALSSQEIAGRLFLSVRTVNNHLQNVYTKLGVNKREQLAEALAPR